MTTPIPNNVYSNQSGTTSTSPFITLLFPRAPTVRDGVAQGYQVTQRWIDTADGNAEYFLVGYSALGGVVSAQWVQLASGSAGSETLTGNDSVVVSPTMGNINLLGYTPSGVATSGSGSTMTITLSSIPNSSLANDSITLTAGAGISISTSPVALGGSTTISTVSEGYTWHNVTGGSATLAAQNGYIANRSTLTTFTLPTSNNIGDTIIIMGLGTGGWEIVYGSNQYIQFGNLATTTTSGNLASSNQFDCCMLVCTVGSGTAPIFQVLNSVGNLSVT